MAAKKETEAVPVAAEQIDTTPEPRPAPPSPAAGGLYRYNPETGELARVNEREG